MNEQPNFLSAIQSCGYGTALSLWAIRLVSWPTAPLQVIRVAHCQTFLNPACPIAQGAMFRRNGRRDRVKQTNHSRRCVLIHGD